MTLKISIFMKIRFNFTCTSKVDGCWNSVIRMSSPFVVQPPVATARAKAGWERARTVVPWKKKILMKRPNL